MSVVLANEIRPVAMPVYCSACFNQNPDARHIDFDAASDRGYGQRDDGLQVAMDDLVLCEGCVREAALLLGMEAGEDRGRELEQLRNRWQAEKDRADRADRYAASLEDAFEHRPVAINTPRRRGRPPKNHDVEAA